MQYSLNVKKAALMRGVSSRSMFMWLTGWNRLGDVLNNN